MWYIFLRPGLAESEPFPREQAPDAKGLLETLHRPIHKDWLQGCTALQHLPQDFCFTEGVSWMISISKFGSHAISCVTKESKKHTNIKLSILLKGCRPCRRPLTEETAKLGADGQNSVWVTEDKFRGYSNPFVLTLSQVDQFLPANSKQMASHVILRIPNSQR